MWLARNKGDSEGVHLFVHNPVCIHDKWTRDDYENEAITEGSYFSDAYLTGYSNVTFENSPVECDLVPKIVTKSYAAIGKVYSDILHGYLKSMEGDI